jgi:hypothetical protein
MSALLLSGYGTPVATAYFIVNGTLVLFTSKDIGQYSDEDIKRRREEIRTLPSLDLRLNGSFE